MAVTGPEGADVGPGLEVEEANGAVGETAGEVAVGEGEGAADEGLMVVAAAGDVGRVEVWDGDGVSPCGEVAGRPMPVDELVVPRGPQSIGTAPDASGEALPQEIRT